MFGLPLERLNLIERTASDAWPSSGGRGFPVDTQMMLSANGIIRRLGPLEVEAEFDLRGRPPYTVLIDDKRRHESAFRYRLRFTEAHELGHFFLHLDEAMLHRETQDTVIEAATVGNRTLVTREIEANAFAGALLMPRTEFRRDIKYFRDAEGWRGTLHRNYAVSYAALDFRFARLRDGAVLSGYAWADSGKIISLIPTIDLELREPAIATAAWRRNRVAANYLLGVIPKDFIARVDAQMRQLSYREAAAVKRECEPITLSSILPEVEHRGNADLFICGYDRGEQKIYFEIGLFAAADQSRDEAA